MSLESLNDLLVKKDFSAILEKIGEEELDTEIFTSEHISILANNILSESALEVTDILANLAKIESHRDIIVEKGAVPPLLSIVNDNPATKTSINCLRIVANVCYDNDKNREIILEAGGLDAIIKFVETVNENSEFEELYVKVASGVLCNFCADNEKVAAALIAKENAIASGLSLILHPNTSLNMCCMLLEAITAHESSLPSFGDKNTLFVMFRCLKAAENHKEIEKDIIGVLDKIAHDDKISDKIYSEIGLKDLFSFVDSMEESSKAKSTIAKLIASILGVDDCKSDTFIETHKPEMELFLKWIHDDDVEMRCAGSLALGNIARTDVNTIKLVEMGVLPNLVKSIASEDAREQHAALGVVKNLSISTANKEPIVEQGFLEVVDVHLIESMHGAIHFQVASILKSLCNECPENCKKMLNHEKIMNLLKKLAKHDEEGIRFETLRCYCFMIRNCSTYAEGIALLKENGSIQHIVDMLDCKFDVLKNDALISLHCFAKSNSENKRYLSECLNLEKNTIAIIKTCPSPEIQSNSIALLATLISCDDFVNGCDLKEWKDVLEGISTDHAGLLASKNAVLEMITNRSS